VSLNTITITSVFLVELDILYILLYNVVFILLQEGVFLVKDSYSWMDDKRGTMNINYLKKKISQ
jgi:hypothetical protein